MARGGTTEGAGLTMGGGICAGVAGAFEVDVVHALAMTINTGAPARISAEWIFPGPSRIMARSIPSDLVMELFWLLLEAGVALLLLLGIVWWTWPRQRKDASRTPDAE